MINTNLPPILHRFQDIAFNRSKIAISLPLLHLMPPMERFLASCHRKCYIAKNYTLLGYIPVAESLSISSTTFMQCAAKAIEFGEITQKGHCHSRSPIVIQIDFLLVINTNLLPILHRFRDIAFDRSKIAIFGYPSCV